MDDNKNIDKSLRDRFSPLGVRDEGWNDPSDIVWENIEREIYKEKKSRFGFLPFILVNLLLLSLLVNGFLIYQNAELKSQIKSNNDESILAENLANQNVLSQTLNSVKSDEESEISGEPSTDSATVQAKVKSQPAPVKNKTVLSKNQDNSKVHSKSTNALYPSNSASERRDVGNDLEIPISETPKNDLKTNLSVNRPLVESIEKLSNNLSPAQYKRSIDSPLVKIDRKQKSGPNLVRSISILPQFFTNNLATNGDQETALTELINKEYGNEGFGLDVQISEPLSNSLELTYGLGIESMSYSTEYFLSLPYSSDQEDIDGEHGYIDFQHSLPTAFGNTDTELRLIRVRNTNDPVSETVGLDFHTNHQFFTIAAPIGLNKVFGSEDSQFRIGIQARPTYLLNGNSSIRTVRSHHSEIDAVNNQSYSIYADLNRFNLGVGVNIGYFKTIKDKHGIELNVGLQEFLFDTYAVNNYSTSIQKFGVSLGYRYQL